MTSRNAGPAGSLLVSIPNPNHASVADRSRPMVMSRIFRTFDFDWGSARQSDTGTGPCRQLRSRQGESPLPPSPTASPRWRGKGDSGAEGKAQCLMADAKRKEASCSDDHEI